MPREGVEVSSLAGFKSRLGDSLSTPVYWKVSLPIAGGLEHAILGHFQPKTFHDSVIFFEEHYAVSNTQLLQWQEQDLYQMDSSLDLFCFLFP